MLVKNNSLNFYLFLDCEPFSRLPHQHINHVKHWINKDPNPINLGSFISPGTSTIGNLVPLHKYDPSYVASFQSAFHTYIGGSSTANQQLPNRYSPQYLVTQILCSNLGLLLASSTTYDASLCRTDVAILLAHQGFVWFVVPSVMSSSVFLSYQARVPNLRHPSYLCSDRLNRQTP